MQGDALPVGAGSHTSRACLPVCLASAGGARVLSGPAQLPSTSATLSPVSGPANSLTKSGTFQRMTCPARQTVSASKQKPAFEPTTLGGILGLIRNRF